ncbi:uncharacterized protein METZ01_LOCUS420894, partial [marine metagenome]
MIMLIDSCTRCQKNLEHISALSTNEINQTDKKWNRS